MNARLDLSDTDRYLARSAAAQVASFLARQAKWMEICAAARLDPSAPYNLRSMPSKNAKHRAYDAGSRLATLLGQERPMNCADLGRLVGLAIAA